MSEENVDLVRRGYEYFARTGEPDASIYAPDIEWHSAAEDPGQEVFHGVEGVKKLIAEVQEAIDDFRTEPFEFLDAGDMDAVRELLDPDVILRPASDWPEPGPYMGREAVIGFYERTREAFDADTVELTGGFSHAADRVVFRWIWHAQGQGPESNMELTTIFTVRNGKVREAEYFWDHDEALEAAGLSE